ncbi:MAG: MDR family oxidoreductase [Hyphomicrobiaceae bacterium]|nr:MDR family oxidoreductase [Hyphomicrobiaceae bacterium]
MNQFKALVARKSDQGVRIEWERLGLEDLMDGDVTVRVSHTTINYKDGLALEQKAPIIRRWPLVPGIDFTGVVEASSHTGFAPGDAVILNGWGVGEGHHGGYAEMARVKGDWLVRKPDGFSAAETMAIGTAGYTAALCMNALIAHEVTPTAGPILVTGAAGGVGSIAVAILAHAGYHVIASTGRQDEAAFLKGLGAGEVIDRAELSGPARPLGKERWAGVIDVAGSHTLANAIAMTRYGGCVAACGLAQGMDLASNVAPFILRGVTLAGIDSVMAPLTKRVPAWDLLARHLPRDKLAMLTVTRPVEDVKALAPQILAGQVRGRIVLEVG